jgi:hypothetical protein
LKINNLILLVSSFFISIVFVYFLAFTYLFYIKGIQNNEIFLNRDEINFIEKYSKTLHHIRHYKDQPPGLQHTKVNELLFTEEQKHESENGFIFMGDSWFEQLMVYKDSSIEINNYFNKKKANYVNAAISSYSPTLISLLYKTLVKDFELNPNNLVIYIDQLDFGDEICRYKKNRYFNKDTNKLEGVKDIFYLPRTSVFYNIAQSDSHWLIKDLKRFNFLINEKFRLTKNRIKRILNKDLNIYGCTDFQIFDNLINPTNDDIQYFKSSIDLMLNTLTEDKNIKNVLIVTFPHRNNLKQIDNYSTSKDQVHPEMLKLNIFENEKSENLITKDFKINVGDFINNYINENNNQKVSHLDFTKRYILKEVNIYNESYRPGDPTSHLIRNDHLNTFTKNIILEIDNFLN